jgi:hypothetical protein
MNGEGGCEVRMTSPDDGAYGEDEFGLNVGDDNKLVSYS